MKSIRQFTGLCPQYDVLVDNMTCKEHLLLYASLKGVEKGSINKEVVTPKYKTTLQSIQTSRGCCDMCGLSSVHLKLHGLKNIP